MPPPAEEGTPLRHAGEVEAESSWWGAESWWQHAPGQPLVAQNEKPEHKAGIRTCVCVYRESEVEIKTMMATWRIAGPRPETLPPLHLSFVVDGSTDPADPSPTLSALCACLGIDPLAPLDDDVFGCRRFGGRMVASVGPYAFWGDAVDEETKEEGAIRTYAFEVWVKNAALPRGKRMSHRLYFKILRARIETGEVAPAPTAVHFQDGDTGSDRGLADVEKLFLLLTEDSDTGVVCSKTRPAQYHPCVWLLRTQQLEYLEMFGSLGGFSYFRSVGCAVGMSVMYRWTTLTEGIVPSEGISVLDKYVSVSKHIVDLVMLDMVEDYGMTMYILQSGAGSVMSHLTHFRTCVPEDWENYFGQRRRWYTGGLVGNFVILFSRTYLTTKYYRFVFWPFLFMTYFSGVCLGLGLMTYSLATAATYAYEGGDTVDDPVVFQDLDVYKCCVVALFGVYAVYFLAVVEATNGERVYTNAFAASVTVALAWASLFLVVMYVGPTAEIASLVSFFVAIILLSEYQTWPRLAINIIVTVINSYVLNVPMMIFAVANLDSAVWGTRTSEQIDSEAKDSFQFKMRIQKIIIAVVYFAANFSFAFWINDFASFMSIMGVAGIAGLLLYIFSLVEWRRQKAYLRKLRLDEHHDDVWPPDHYQKGGGALCCDGCF